ncbi:ankyrin repeat domain-containing protein [Legionella brunensis]|uniref:Uncharacterized protein n=1 Tax=Legionella brunensis TaxID=29422 RepID=A0A0W0SF75_9GAMM|nr:ankyrin repeat domain-containing protein [Legionella brunensis]KTC81541.1 hypothetical protein Lbru_2061 [Legionella brunensis]
MGVCARGYNENGEVILGMIHVMSDPSKLTSLLEQMQKKLDPNGKIEIFIGGGKIEDIGSRTNYATLLAIIQECNKKSKFNLELVDDQFSPFGKLKRLENTTDLIFDEESNVFMEIRGGGWTEDIEPSLQKALEEIAELKNKSSQGSKPSEQDIESFISNNLLELLFTTNKSWEVLDLLLEHTSPNLINKIVNRSIDKLWEFACKNSDENLAHFLLGSKVSLFEKEGYTPGHFAVIFDSLNMLSYLMEQSEFDINAVDKFENKSILLFALQSLPPNEKIIKKLLDSENIYLKKSDPKLPLQVALSTPNISISIKKQMILMGGMDPDIPNQSALQKCQELISQDAELLACYRRRMFSMQDSNQFSSLINAVGSPIINKNEEQVKEITNLAILQKKTNNHG